MNNLTTFLDELEVMEKKASPAKWEVRRNKTHLSIWSNYSGMLVKPENGSRICYFNAGTGLYKENPIRERDMSLIVETRNALPKLIAIIRRQNEALEFYAKSKPNYDDDYEKLIRPGRGGNPPLVYGKRARQALSDVDAILKGGE